MPEVDGLEATRMIRQLEVQKEEGGAGAAHVPIAALTASAFEFEKQACFSAGMDHFLTKPVRPKDLEDLFQALCAHKPR